MKAAVGLSASVFALVYAACQLSMPQFLLACMLAPAAACAALLPAVNEVPRMQRDELMPHGLLSKPARSFMQYQARARQRSHIDREISNTRDCFFWVSWI